MQAAAPMTHDVQPRAGDPEKGSPHGIAKRVQLTLTADQAAAVAAYSVLVAP